MKTVPLDVSETSSHASARAPAQQIGLELAAAAARSSAMVRIAG